MAKKFFSKALSVGLSLTLCAGLVAPSFAATFTDLQSAVNGTGGTKIEDSDYEGWAAHTDEEGNTTYGITAKGNEDGSREVNLHEDVVWTDGKDAHTWVDVAGKNLTLNMNGNAIDGKNNVEGNNRNELGQYNGDPKGSWAVLGTWSAEQKTNVTINGGADENDETQRGTLTGGYFSGVFIDQFPGKVGVSTVTINHVDITGNYMDNYSWDGLYGGGGVHLGKGNTLNLNDVKVTENYAYINGGGIHVEQGATANIKDSVISCNATKGENGDIWGQGTVNLENTKVENNFYNENDSEYDTHENVKFVWEVTTPARPGVPGEETCICPHCGKVVDTRPIDPLPTPTPVTRITDPAIPLSSGPVTRAEFIDYLWRHEGEPESAGVCTFTDVEDTHEYFDALCWADENGVAEAYFGVEGHEDGTFEPDELVTVAAVREFLGNFETVFGAQAVAAADLTTLTGSDDEAVLNCGEVLAEFFGEEYAPAEAEDEAA